MPRYLLVLVILLGSLPLAGVQGDVSAALTAAEALYYEAKFTESIAVLLPLDTSLQSQPGRIRDKVSVKLQLALAYVGLSQLPQAKQRLSEINRLDPAFSLDPAIVPLKVLSLFDEARAESGRATCQSICLEGDRLLDAADADGLVAHISNTGGACGCLQAVAMDASEFFYRRGREALTEQDYPQALNDFSAALKLHPGHELAASYRELARSRMHLAAFQLLVEWSGQFHTRNFQLAAVTYAKIRLGDTDGTATEALEYMRSQYREALNPLLKAWKDACDDGNWAVMDDAYRRALELLPDPAIAADILEQMRTCTGPNCIQVAPELALTRLKTSVSPEFPRGLRVDQGAVAINIRINKTGNVVVGDMSGGTPEVRDVVKGAVERWTFTPAVIDNELRCVDTEVTVPTRPR